MAFIHCPVCKSRCPFFRFLLITKWAPYRCRDCFTKSRFSNVRVVAAVLPLPVVLPFAIVYFISPDSFFFRLPVMFAVSLAILYRFLRLCPCDSQGPDS